MLHHYDINQKEDLTAFNLQYWLKTTSSAWKLILGISNCYSHITSCNYLVIMGTSQSILYQVLFQIIKAKITHCFMKHIWCNKIFPKHGKFLTFTNKTNLVAKFSWPVKSLLSSSKSCITSCNSGIRNCYLAIHPQRKWLIKVKILMSENNFFETRIM